MSPSSTKWASLFGLAMAFFALSNSAQAESVNLQSSRRSSVSPWKTYEAGLNKRQQEEGVFGVPVYRRQGADAPLERRGGKTYKTNIDTIELTVPLTVGGKSQKYTLSLSGAANSGVNVKDCPTCFDPTKSSKAKPVGKVSSVYGYNATEYVLNDLKVFGSLPLNGASWIYNEASGRESSDQGSFELGLKGSGTYNTSGRSSLEVLAASKSLSKPIFSLALAAGSVSDPGILLLGGEVKHDPSRPITYAPSIKGRWGLDISIAGHKGQADLLTSSAWITTPTDVAKDLIKKAGLKALVSEDGTVSAEIDCQKGSSVPLTVAIKDINLIIMESDQAVRQSDGHCLFIVQGVDQGKYPTPFSLGEEIFLLYNVYFDFAQNKIGFAMPDHGPQSSSGQSQPPARRFLHGEQVLAGRQAGRPRKKLGPLKPVEPPKCPIDDPECTGHGGLRRSVEVEEILLQERQAGKPRKKLGPLKPTEPPHCPIDDPECTGHGGLRRREDNGGGLSPGQASPGDPTHRRNEECDDNPGSPDCPPDCEDDCPAPTKPKPRSNDEQYSPGDPTHEETHRRDDDDEPCPDPNDPECPSGGVCPCNKDCGGQCDPSKKP